MQIGRKKPQKYTSFKKAAKISGYSPDYIGCLIRKGKIQKITREITGLKPHKTKFQKIFAIGWQLTLATIVLFLLIGIGPAEIFQKLVGVFAEEEKTVNLYSILFEGSWQNPQNAQGQPGVAPPGDFNSFSEENSAVYNDGLLNLICQNFKTSEELANSQIQSAKIKFSFAIGEKESDLEIPIEEIDFIPEPVPPIETTTSPTSFLQKIKNFFKHFSIVKVEEVQNAFDQNRAKPDFLAQNEADFDPSRLGDSHLLGTSHLSGTTTW